VCEADGWLAVRACWIFLEQCRIPIATDQANGWWPERVARMGLLTAGKRWLVERDLTVGRWRKVSLRHPGHRRMRASMQQFHQPYQ
jgi:hypothetical protein